MLIWKTFKIFISFNNGLEWLNLFAWKIICATWFCFLRIPLSGKSISQAVADVNVNEGEIDFQKAKWQTL